MNRKEAIEYIKWYFAEDDGMAADASVKEAIQALVPELKESEDERIRKEILEFVRTRGGFKGEWIAYLEKQKESLHIPESCKENADSFTGDEGDRTINGCLLAANAERRCKRASEELLEELGLADYTKFFYEQGVEKGKKEGEKQKEQKSADLLDEIKHYLATTPREQHQKAREEIEKWYKEHMVQTQDTIHKGSESPYDPWNDCDVFVSGRHITQTVGNILRWADDHPIEQKPDENITDEEIKQAMDDIHNFKIAVTNLAKTFNIRIDHDRDIDWHNFCASLLTYLKRHAEWSEVDETGYMDLMWCIEQARKSAKDENDMGNVWYAEHWLKERLKSLLSRFE